MGDQCVLCYVYCSMVNTCTRTMINCMFMWCITWNTTLVLSIAVLLTSSAWSLSFLASNSRTALLRVFLFFDRPWRTASVFTKKGPMIMLLGNILSRISFSLSCISTSAFTSAAVWFWASYFLEKFEFAWMYILTVRFQTIIHGLAELTAELWFETELGNEFIDAEF